MKQTTKKKHLFLRVLLCVLLALALWLVGATLCNRLLRTNYDSLSATDQELFQKISLVATQNGQIGSMMWTDYDMTPTILVQKGNHLNLMNDTVNLLRGNVYAVGVKGLENKWYAQKIEIPEELHLPEVYRLAILTPGIAETWRPWGNFAEPGEGISLGDSSHVFFFKYNKLLLEGPVKSDEEFLSFWSHESFHFLRQADWGDGFSNAVPDSEAGFLRLGVQYAALDELLRAFEQGTDTELQSALDKYVVASESCREQNEEEFNQAALHETLEGCAQYVGIRAAEISDGTLKVMPFDGEKRSFLYYMNMMAQTPGQLSEVQWNRYESGALLCQVLDRLGSDDWQQQLNEQNVTTLYELIKNQASAELPTLEEVESAYDMTTLQAYAEALAEQVAEY